MGRLSRFAGLLGFMLLWTVGLIGCGGGPSGPSLISTAHDVVLSWDASSSAVVRYNVYRSTPGHGYNLLNSTSSSKNTYTDSDVSAGATYTYRVTAVDSAGLESAPTHSVTVVVPTS